MTDIYRQLILDHYHQPRNFGQLSNPDASTSVSNPFCGDRLSVALKLNQDTISDIKFTGNGCAISIASASIITQHLKGKSLKEVKKITSDQLLKLIGVELSPVRVKCALLVWQAISQALAEYKSGAPVKRTKRAPDA